LFNINIFITIKLSARNKHSSLLSCSIIVKVTHFKIKFLPFYVSQWD
jgi:hypothetical protein